MVIPIKGNQQAAWWSNVDCRCSLILKLLVIIVYIMDQIVTSSCVYVRVMYVFFV